MKKKVVPKLQQEVKVNVDIVTRKFQDFTAKYIISNLNSLIHNPDF